MATAPAKKVTLSTREDGTQVFTFPGLTDPATGAPVEVAIALADLSDEIKHQALLMGVATKARGFMVPNDETETSAEVMHRKLVAGVELLRAGQWRKNAAGEAAPQSTLVVEGALIYKKMKARLAATKSIDGWQDQEVPETLASLAPEIEALAEHVTNPEDVEKARADAAAKGEDADAAAKAAAITRLDVLKGSTLFKLAYGEAKAAREIAKKAALERKLAEEAADAVL